jgi:hypothetical protein
MQLHKPLLAAALLILLAASQVTGLLLAGPTATLTGRVTDPSDAVMAGVKVEATNVETNVVYSGETNGQGLYNIPNLPPGTYRVRVEKPAFRTINKPDVELHVQDVIPLNFSMEVGSAAESINVEAGAPLIQADPQRGGDFVSREVRNLPLAGQNPLSLARTLPGAIVPAGTMGYSGPLESSFSVNGQRSKANNYLLDGTENNDFTYTGPAQPFNIADAIEEVVVQTGNFGVEFGRANGGILNVVTKSGTNNLHGTLLWRYQSQRFNSVSNVDKRTQVPRLGFNDNVYGFTVGAPVRRDKTFFFGGFQQDAFRPPTPFPLVVATDAAVDTLRSLFPANPRLDLYLGFLGGLRGTASPIPIQLGNDPVTRVNRGVVQFATATLVVPVSQGGPQWLARLDQNLSEAHRLAFRYIYNSRPNYINSITFPGFIQEAYGGNQNFLFTDHYTFSSSWTNEFRFSYGRLTATQEISSQSVPEARTLPIITATPIAMPGILFGQPRHANNLLFQETQTRLSGRHTFRYGVEFLAQSAAQTPFAYDTGDVDYTASTGYSAFANFLDDFSGPSGRWRKDFDPAVVHPDQFHQTYFFQDTWLPAPSLSLTLGLRYENFGQVVNALRYPAFAGFDPNDFLKPNHVNTDNKDFGPAFALAWSPSYRPGWLHKLLGENKFVWRGGYQISYVPLEANALTLLLANAPPNAISADIPATAGPTGRGLPNWFEAMPLRATAASPTDTQAGTLEKDFRNAYTERWSFGFQRQLSNKMVLDGSYIGSESHRLATWADVNPRQLNNSYPHPDLGPRTIRTSQGNSSYHAMQWRLDRRFARGFQVNASYTWSRNLDSTSEGDAAVNTQGNQRNLTSMPVAQGGLKLDRGPSDFDRTHRFTVAYIWDVPGPAHGILMRTLGGWSISGITSFQSGAPFSLQNGLDRNNDGWMNDRPDIGNPLAPINSRAIMTPISGTNSCATGYRNLDTGSCVTPGDVHWVQAGLFSPPNANASTVGRNTLVADGINSFDLSLFKSLRIREQKRLEFRWEAFNALNHPQFTQIPNRNVLNAAPGQFLNRDFTESGIRSMWAQMKFLF